MERPPNIDRPFFAYGLFRPGQLAFFQLRELVSNITEPSRVAGSLLLRDGLPIIDPAGHGFIQGALLTFLPTRVAEAYDRIAAMEPDKHYRWHEAQVDGTSTNVLVGRSPKKGSAPCEDAEWNGWDDPLDDLDPEAGERERCEGRDDSEDGRDAGDGAEPLDAELPPPLAQSTPSETSNATHQVRRAAEAGHERTHFAVTCMRLLGRLVTSIVFCRFQYLTDYR